MQRGDGVDATMLRKVAVAVGEDVWSDSKATVDNGEAVTLLVDPAGSTAEFGRVRTRGGDEGYIRRAYLEPVVRRQSRRVGSASKS